ncbi:MAG: tRNA (guanosine(37)-N1)-methyltransferase TrmD [Clostridiales bacterium]|nr:tRNA (guanosine(37)-N1)-methyltransferase TrmD [Clostridiales bacterium]
MRFSVISLFPGQIDAFLKESIIGRAREKRIIDIDFYDIRDYSGNPYGKVDDTLYGGGTGMLIQCEPVYRCYEDVCSSGKPYVIYVSPKGKVLDQKKVRELAGKDHIAILCGHYEGIDSRVTDEIVDEEISIGDYVLTGGEIAAVTIIDSVSRMIEGVLPNEDAYTNESHMNGTLEASQYTKPRIWHDREVPEVLLNGNQAQIDDYNRTMSLVETMDKRPDMFDKLALTEEDWQKVLARKRQN